jgi:hypothetical protein
MAASAATAPSISNGKTASSTTTLWNLLDEDHVPWKKVLQICRELPDDKPMLHFIIDRDPPPKYITDLLEIRRDDLLKGEATVILKQQHVWCYPLGIASRLSSDLVFREIVIATKQALLERNSQPSTRVADSIDLLAGITITKLSPKRLTSLMQAFPTVRSIKESLLEVVLFKHDSIDWEVLQCILEHHPSVGGSNSSDLGVSFFRILSACCHTGAVNFPPPHWISRIPKVVRYLMSHESCSSSSNPYLLRVALDTLVPLLMPTTTAAIAATKRKKSTIKNHPKRRIIPEILQVLLEACPQSAQHRCRETGRLPLHVAAHVEGCMHMVWAYPSALKTRCPVTKLYPFQLAAMHSSTSSNESNNASSSVEIVWNLLRAAPELLEPTNDCSTESSSIATVSQHHLQLARHEMEMARACRRFDEQRKSLERDRNQVMEVMAKERLELVLLTRREPKFSSLENNTQEEQLSTTNQQEDSIGTRRSKRLRFSQP